MTAATPTTRTADDWPRRVAILGVGLLGGSVALAIRRVRPQTTLVGHARSHEKREWLRGSGIVDLAVGSIDQAAGGCDVIVVASPVDRIAALAIEAARACPAHCLITDVGSTKKGIVGSISRVPSAEEIFVAAHPIAGSEKSGAEHASDRLLDDKVVVLTPTDRTEPAMIEKAREFWGLTGGNTVQMTPSQHDVLLAAVSHVPHLVSALVAKMASPEARPLVGSGWQDITRVAAGDPALWTAICQENRDSIRQQLGRFADELNHLRRILDDEDGEALRDWLAEAKQVKQQTQ